jgi:cytoskeleton protein RodZ
VPTGVETLRLNVTETTWVEVLGEGSRVVVQRNLQPGESIALSQSAPLSVVVGRADAAEVWVRGQRFVLEPHTRNNVARFEVR